MVLNRKGIVAATAAAGIAVGALAGGGAAFASAASPARSPVTAVATTPASVWPDGGCSQMGKMWSGQDPAAKAAAGYLGLSQARLGSELQSGKSLADVARAQGKSVSGLKSTILAAITSWVNASGNLSGAQKASAISEVKSHLDAIVTMACRPGMGSHQIG